MRISNEVRVGIMFFFGLALLLLLIVTMTRWGQDRHAYAFTIRFAQAQGLQNGADVLVAGVKVGQVKTVSLDANNQALVLVRVDRRVRLYSSYAYTIGVGGLVGERYIEIIPTATTGSLVRPNSQVAGTTTADMNELISNANGVVSKLSTMADSLNTLVGDKQAQQNFKQAVADLHRTMASSATMMASVNQTVQRNQAIIDLMVADLADVAGDLRHMSDTLTPQLEHTQLLANLETASENAARVTQRLDNIMVSADTILRDPTITGSLRESAKNIQLASVDLTKTMAETRSALSVLPSVMANVQQASADLPKITHPLSEVMPETADNVLHIAQQLRTTSDTLGGVAQRITRIGTEIASLNIEPEARLGITSHGSATRSDLNLDVRGKTSMLRLGIADIGHQSGLNLQFGNKLRDDLWFRYGLVQSSFGVGAEYQPTPNWRLSSELFDPAQLRANLLFDYRMRALGQGWWLTAGGYDLFEKNSLGIGLTYRP